MLAVFTFSIGSVSLHVFRNNGVGDDSTRLRGMRVIAPAAFVVSTLVILWEPWDILRKTIPVIVATLLYYVVRRTSGTASPRGEIAGGIWLVVYLVVVYAVSYAGSFGGRGWLPGPWDSVVVAARLAGPLRVGHPGRDGVPRRPPGHHRRHRALPRRLGEGAGRGLRTIVGVLLASPGEVRTRPGWRSLAAVAADAARSCGGGHESASPARPR